MMEFFDSLSFPELLIFFMAILLVIKILERENL